MEKDDRPRGTLAILLIFLILLLLSWGGVYLIMIQRGGV